MIALNKKQIFLFIFGEMPPCGSKLKLAFEEFNFKIRHPALDRHIYHS